MEVGKGYPHMKLNVKLTVQVALLPRPTDRG